MTTMKIHILGTGCAKCKLLADNVWAGADALGLDVEIVKVTDVNEIMGFGVIMMPALAVDGKVIVVGKVVSAEEIKNLIQ